MLNVSYNDSSEDQISLTNENVKVTGFNKTEPILKDIKLELPDIPNINENLNASVLYFSITSNGSIPFPKDFDIFLPKLSLTMP